MELKAEQREVIKVCVDSVKTLSETVPILKTAYGNENFGSAKAFTWYRRFCDGWEDVADDFSEGRLSSLFRRYKRSKWRYNIVSSKIFTSSFIRIVVNGRENRRFLKIK